jgi:ribosome biogenesis GTPase
MSKRRLTQQQQARIKKRQTQRITNSRQVLATGTGEKVNAEQEGLVIAHYGVYADIEAENAEIYHCHIRQHLGAIVPGDRVVFSPASNNSGILVAVKPRNTLLERTIASGRRKPIAANVDQVIIVIASQPKFVASMLDSYLVATALYGLRSIIVFNKKDLLQENSADLLKDQLNNYQKIGYPLLWASVRENSGLKELACELKGYTSIVVGQSGVGKSSLIASFLPEFAAIDIALPGIQHATHTTTAARLYHLPQGGDLIDSPGVRDFTLGEITPHQLARGFVEFHPYLGACQFRNCQHQQESNCAIQQAVEQGLISVARLASYQRLLGT